jgi:hypothetical protein
MSIQIVNGQIPMSSSSSERANFPVRPRRTPFVVDFGLRISARLRQSPPYGERDPLDLRNLRTPVTRCLRTITRCSPPTSRKAFAGRPSSEASTPCAAPSMGLPRHAPPHLKVRRKALLRPSHALTALPRRSLLPPFPCMRRNASGSRRSKSAPGRQTQCHCSNMKCHEGMGMLSLRPDHWPLLKFNDSPRVILPSSLPPSLPAGRPRPSGTQGRLVKPALQIRRLILIPFLLLESSKTPLYSKSPRHPG